MRSPTERKLEYSNLARNSSESSVNVNPENSRNLLLFLRSPSSSYINLYKAQIPLRGAVFNCFSTYSIWTNFASFFFLLISYNNKISRSTKYVHTNTTENTYRIRYWKCRCWFWSVVSIPRFVVQRSSCSWVCYVIKSTEWSSAAPAVFGK